MELTTDKVQLIRQGLIMQRDELKVYLQSPAATYNKPALKALARKKLEGLNSLIAEADEYLLIQDSITPPAAPVTSAEASDNILKALAPGLAPAPGKKYYIAKKATPSIHTPLMLLGYAGKRQYYTSAYQDKALYYLTKDEAQSALDYLTDEHFIEYDKYEVVWL